MSTDLENRPRLANPIANAAFPSFPTLASLPSMRGNELYADITASNAMLQQTLTAVTQTWITSMLDTFNQSNAMVWNLFNWPGAPIAKQAHDDHDTDR